MLIGGLGLRLSGFVVVTANGEETFLSEAERLETVRTVVSAHGGQKFVIAGVDETINA